jgi:hypothetical protein
MGSFQISIERPEEIIPRLGKKELHWKKGRSAFELSTAWMRVNGMPDSVRNTVEQAAEWRDAKFLEGIFERETKLPGRGRPSQTDLLAIVALRDGNVIIGVEGKVDEPFGPLTEEWLRGAKDQNRRERLSALCSTLGVGQEAANGLYYQLFHRTCAAIYEAKHFSYKRAVMLVHSFAQSLNMSSPPCFSEFSAFSKAVHMPVLVPGSMSDPKVCEGIEARLAWVSDVAST